MIIVKDKKSSESVKTVYDAEKARLHKQEIDNAVAKFKEETTKRGKRRTIAGICAGVAFVIALLVTKMAGWVIALGFASCIPIGFYVGITQWCNEQNRPSNEYTPDIEYYLATDGKKVLRTKIDTDLEFLPNVRISVENPDKTVTESELHFKVVKKTDLNQIILNINEGVIYAPYKES